MESGSSDEPKEEAESDKALEVEEGKEPAATLPDNGISIPIMKAIAAAAKAQQSQSGHEAIIAEAVEAALAEAAADFSSLDAAQKASSENLLRSQARSVAVLLGIGRLPHAPALSRAEIAAVQRVLRATEMPPLSDPTSGKDKPDTSIAAASTAPQSVSIPATEAPKMPGVTQDAPEPSRDDKLWMEVLETASDADEINAAFVVRAYKEALKDRPLLSLVRHVNERIGIYHNLLEAIKAAPEDGTGPSDLTAAQQLKAKYEGLKLVPPAKLPNPWAHETASYAIGKLRKYGALLLDIVAQYAEELAVELKVSTEVTLLFEVGIGLAPELTIGIERSGKRVRI